MGVGFTRLIPAYAFEHHIDPVGAVGHFSAAAKEESHGSEITKAQVGG
ncbi:MAG TPA: hypothetical protein VJN18_02200 [Polyangiaceae bacterium]|nr:hypothetical protein [Polyangiaceae bacterium]